MRILQDELNKIQSITNKEYDVIYTNNAIEEYVFVYEDVLQDIIDDLIEVAQNG